MPTAHPSSNFERLFRECKLTYSRQSTRLRRCLRFTDAGVIAFLNPPTGRYCFVSGQNVSGTSTSSLSVTPLLLENIVSECTLRRFREAAQECCALRRSHTFAEPKCTRSHSVLWQRCFSESRLTQVDAKFAQSTGSLLFRGTCLAHRSIKNHLF